MSNGPVQAGGGGGVGTGSGSGIGGGVYRAAIGGGTGLSGLVKDPSGAGVSPAPT